MVQQSISKEGLTFNELEKEIFRTVCQKGREIIASMLESMDEEIRDERDKDVYENLGLRETHVETMMGRVSYKRRYYRFMDEDGIKKQIFLLDEKIDIFKEGNISAALKDASLYQVIKNSYRTAANNIGEFTGIDLSHTSLWDMVQKTGENLWEKQRAQAELYDMGECIGTREVDVLFEESDGIHLRLQGQDRKKHGKTKELKLALTYEGWSKVGKDRYRLEGKKFCAGFNTADEFCKMKEGMIASEYDVGNIKLRLQNGDGAAWTHQKMDGRIISQLDPFHLKRNLRRAISDKKSLETVEQLLENKDIPTALEVVDILADSTEGEKQQKKLNELYSYMKRNREYLTPYLERGLPLPNLGQGLEYRGMGTIENQNCNVVTMRMKGRKGSWSIDGGLHMALLLCAKASNDLDEFVSAQWDSMLPERYEKHAVVGMSAASALRPIGKGDDGGVRHGRMPYTGAAMTNGRKAIRNAIESDWRW